MCSVLYLCLADNNLSLIRVAPHPKLVLTANGWGDVFTVWTIEVHGKSSHPFKGEGEIQLKVTDSVFEGEMEKWTRDQKLPKYLKPSSEETDYGERKYVNQTHLYFPKFEEDMFDYPEIASLTNTEMFVMEEGGHIELSLLRLPTDGCGSSNPETLAKLRFT